ncbi:MAG: hypothetical protein IKW51_03545 [Bacteroidales bacterium]|nr:hypothetical protein [Bacteroidales bacterium]
MKKQSFLLLISMMFSVSLYSQKSVAVYVTSSESVPKETSKILGSELVSAITKNENYIAVERTDDFLSQISNEQGVYSKIDDNQLYNFGKKFGASNVCVADITKFGDEYYIVARLLDINTAKVWKTSKITSTLNSLSELINASELLSEDLFGSKKEFSTYEYGNDKAKDLCITRIENFNNYTKVSFKYLSKSAQNQIGIDRRTYIEDFSTNERYNLIDANNINIIDPINKNYNEIGEGWWEYSLLFDRIPDDAQNIMVVEPDGWKFTHIILRPYENENTYVFEDKAHALYEKWKKEQEEQYGKKEFSTYSYGDNSGNRSFITKIENTNTHTKVTIKLFSAFETEKIGISRETYIVDIATNEQYKLKDASNIVITSEYSSTADRQLKPVGKKGICEFTLFFERIPDNVRNIRITEKFSYNEIGWEFKDITLKPYGQKGIYVFEYDDENTMNEEYNKFLKTLVYKINFQNKKYDAQYIYVNGKLIDRVSANSNKTFYISIYEYGQLKAVQAEGYLLYPDEVVWTLNNNQQPHKGQEFNIIYK